MGERDEAVQGGKATAGGHEERSAANNFIIVKSLSKTTRKVHINEIFGYYGDVLHVDMQRSGEARIKYGAATDAERALVHMNGGKIDGTTVSVMFLDSSQHHRHVAHGRGGSPNRDRVRMRSRSADRFAASGRRRDGPVRDRGSSRSRSRDRNIRREETRPGDRLRRDDAVQDRDRVNLTRRDVPQDRYAPAVRDQFRERDRGINRNVPPREYDRYQPPHRTGASRYGPVAGDFYGSRDRPIGRDRHPHSRSPPVRRGPPGRRPSPSRGYRDRSPGQYGRRRSFSRDRNPVRRAPPRRSPSRSRSRGRRSSSSDSNAPRGRRAGRRRSRSSSSRSSSSRSRSSSSSRSRSRSSSGSRSISRSRSRSPSSSSSKT